MSVVPDLPESIETSSATAREGRRLAGVLWLTTVEGLAVLASAFASPRFGPLRGLLLASTFALTAACVWAAIRSFVDRSWLERGLSVLRSIAGRPNAPAIATAGFYLGLAAVILAVFGISLRQNPPFADLLAAFVDRGLVPLAWLALAAFQCFVLLAMSSGQRAARWIGAFAAGGVVLVLTLLFWYGAEGQLLFYNVDMRLTDQSAYMDYARLLRDSGYTYPGDFNRMPVYPFLLSLLLKPGITDAEFFLAAKYLNLFLSIGILFGLGVLFFRRMGGLWAVNLTLIAAFSVFIYKAGWVQAELLFYFLNTLLFLMMWRTLQRPSLWLAVATGAVAGLAHLTKASLWPGLALFALLGLLRGLTSLRRIARGAGRLRKAAIESALAVPLVALAFLAVIYPYISTSKRIAGRYFYNVNSTFYVWYDSWEEAEAGTKAHGDRLGWPDMPAEDIPSPAKYLREHTAADMARRLIEGGWEVLGKIAQSYGYAKYILLYGGVLLIAAVWKWTRVREVVSHNPFPLVFLLGYFTVYTLMYFWYAPIASGDRLILAQFIPLLIALMSGVEALLPDERLRVGRTSVAWLAVVHVAALALVSSDAMRALVRGVYILRGGG